jgi:hypothetical protein
VDLPDTLAHELRMDRREGWLGMTDGAVAVKDGGWWAAKAIQSSGADEAADAAWTMPAPR